MFCSVDGHWVTSFRESLHEKATYEATISQLHGDLAAHKSHMQVLAMRLDQLHVEVESKCKAFCLPVKCMDFLCLKFLIYLYVRSCGLKICLFCSSLII